LIRAFLSAAFFRLWKWFLYGSKLFGAEGKNQYLSYNKRYFLKQKTIDKFTKSPTEYFFEQIKSFKKLVLISTDSYAGNVL